MPTDRPTWPWWRILLWASLAVPMCVWQAPHFVRALEPPRNRIIDFFQEWGSARLYRDGEPIYGNLRSAMGRYLGYKRYEGTVFNTFNAHPPSSVLMVLPLSWLDYPQACLAWNLLSLLALVASVGISLRQLRLGLSRWALLPVLALVWLCFPLWEQVIYGQFNLVLLFLLVATWAADRSGRPVWAGVWLGTAVALKLFPGLLFLYFIVRRRWTVVLSGGLTFAAWTGATLALFGIDPYRDYIGHVLPYLTKYRDSYQNISLPGFWHKLFDGTGRGGHSAAWWKAPLLAKALAALSCLAVLAVAVVAAWRVRSRAGQDQVFGAYLAAMVLVSPIAWNHYGLLLLIPFLLLWAGLPRGNGTRPVVWLLLALLGMNPYFFYIPFMGAHPENFTEIVAQPVHTLTVTSYHTYALLALFALGVYAARREDRLASPPAIPTREGRVPSRRRPHGQRADAVAVY